MRMISKIYQTHTKTSFKFCDDVKVVNVRVVNKDRSEERV